MEQLSLDAPRLSLAAETISDMIVSSLTAIIMGCDT
jgi:hypothetical protein